MIPAKEAYIKTKYRNRIKQIMLDCEKSLLNAIEYGLYSTVVQIDIENTPEEVYHEVEEQLHRFGYKTELGHNRQNFLACALSGGYETLTITWKDDEETDKEDDK